MDGQANAGFEDGFGFGARNLRVIHRCLPHFFDGPAAGEETVLLENRVAIERHRTVVACPSGSALGGKSLGKLCLLRSNRLGLDPQYVEPVCAAVIRRDIMRLDAWGPLNLFREKISQP